MTKQTDITHHKEKTHLYQTIYVPETVATTIQKYLNAKDEADFQGEDNTISYTAKFPNGMEIDVQCCGCQSESSWTQAVLYNRKGGECGCSEPGDEFFGDWSIEDKNTVYHVEVKIVPEKDALSKALFDSGYDAISDFVGHDFDPNEDKDTIQNRIDEAFDQMPEEELNKFLLKYDLTDGKHDEVDPETDLALALEAFNHDVVRALNVPDFGMEISKVYGIPDDELWIYWEWSRLGKSDVKKFKLPQKKITAETVTQVRAWMYQMIIVIINQR